MAEKREEEVVGCHRSANESVWHTGNVCYLLRTWLKLIARLPLGQTLLPSARMLQGLAVVLLVLAGVEASCGLPFAWQPPAPALRPLHPARAMRMRGAGAAPLRGGGVLMGKAGFQGGVPGSPPLVRGPFYHA